MLNKVTGHSKERAEDRENAAPRHQTELGAEFGWSIIRADQSSDNAALCSIAARLVGSSPNSNPLRGSADLQRQGADRPASDLEGRNRRRVDPGHRRPPPPRIDLPDLEEAPKRSLAFYDAVGRRLERQGAAR